MRVPSAHRAWPRIVVRVSLSYTCQNSLRLPRREASTGVSTDLPKMTDRISYFYGNMGLTAVEYTLAVSPVVPQSEMHVRPSPGHNPNQAPTGAKPAERLRTLRLSRISLSRQKVRLRITVASNAELAHKFVDVAFELASGHVVGLDGASRARNFADKILHFSKCTIATRVLQCAKESHVGNTIFMSG